MKCIFAVPSLREEFGGPATLVLGLGDSLRRAGVEISYHTSDGSHASYGPTLDPNAWTEAEVIHNFGVWTPFNHGVCALAQRIRKPYLISPLGMLEPWALSQKRLKKRLAWRLYQRRDLLRASALHATSEMELGNLRALGVDRVIYVIPHAVDLPPASEVQQNSKRPDGMRIALFLSRIHKKKGVLQLIQAWAALRPVDWLLFIAGPENSNHGRYIKKVVRDLNLCEHIFFLGPAYGEIKNALFGKADIFILPTFSENFGMVVAEALSYGVPVITTRGAPWSQLIASKSGWWIETGVKPLIAALHEALQMPSAELRAMGTRGRNLIKNNFNWDNVAEGHIDAYSEQIQASRQEFDQ